MKISSRRSFLGTTAGGVASIGLLGPTDARAGDPICPPNVCSLPPMGLFGIVRRQLLRVSVFNHSSPNVEPIGIEVLDAGGKLLGSEQIDVQPGGGAFADFDPAADLPPRDRMLVHVAVTGDVPVGATAEVYRRRSGVTEFPTTPCGTPAPEARMSHGSVGLTRRQAVRLSIFIPLNQFPTAPCGVRFTITDLDGNVLAQQDTEVPEGTGAALEWGPDSPNFPQLASGERLQIHGTVMSEQPESVATTLEVFDARSGVTYYPTSPCGLPLPPV